MYQQALCSSLELVINKALTLNVGETDLGELEQKTLTIILDELSFPISFVCFYDSKLSANNEKMRNAKVIVSSLTEHSDCTINTSLGTLKELQAKQQLTQLIKQDKLDIDGDIKVAQQFMQFGQSLNIDWLSELASHIGDIPTFKLARFAKKSLKKMNFVKQQIEFDASEYLVHEQRLVVTNSQISAFNRGVNEVTDEVATLEKRLHQILEKIPTNK